MGIVVWKNGTWKRMEKLDAEHAMEDLDFLVYIPDCPKIGPPL